MSATRLAEKIRRGEVTSLEVVETHISQIQKVNPVLNAVVKDRFELARKEARAADEKTRRSPPDSLPPLHGVPCTIKECFALTGMPHTSGLVARKGVIANQDAITVARLRDAGVIPLGVTNVPELCMWIETNNRIYGRTNNPYDPKRMVGGSSGGEGAIVSACGAPFGLGSDVGGSIRFPSFFNGVFGHKPSGGIVPTTGQFPLPGEAGYRYLTAGPIARHAEDLLPVLNILKGPDGEDKTCTPCNLGDPSKVALKDLTVLDVEDNGLFSVSEDLKSAQRKCADFLARRGARVKKTKIELLKKSLFIWAAMLASTGGPSLSTMLGNGTPISIPLELLRLLVGRSDHIIATVVVAMLEKTIDLMPSRTEHLIELGHVLKQELTDAIGPKGVMLYPTFTRPAPVHNATLFRPFGFIYSAIFNVIEFPVTQVPLGLNEIGLPLGVQVIGTHGNDHLTIAVALELEKEFGGWVPPSISKQ